MSQETDKYDQKLLALSCNKNLKKWTVFVIILTFSATDVGLDL